MWLLQWLSGKESACSAGVAGRNRFDPWVRKIPWKRAWQYSCLENPYGQRGLAGYSPWGRKESDTTQHSTYALAEYDHLFISLNKLTQISLSDWPQQKTKQAKTLFHSPDISPALPMCLCSVNRAWCTLTEGFPGGSVVKNPPTMQETWVQCLGQEHPLEKGKATHPSILAWRIPWTDEPCGPRLGSQRVGHD